MNVFGVDILQLVIYVCVGASLVVVIYILKLTRTRKKTKTLPEPNEETFSEVATVTTPDENIKQLIVLVDKMWSHSVGLTSNPHSHSTIQSSSPRKRRTRKKAEPTEKLEIKELPPPPTPSHSIQKIDEDTYKPTKQDEELLETIRKQLEEKV